MDGEASNRQDANAESEQTRAAQTEVMTEVMAEVIAKEITKVIKGRGSVSNTPSRFLKLRTEAFDDGWSTSASSQGCDVRQQSAAGADAEQPQVQTRLYLDRTRTLITKNKSPDIPFDQSINPYKGCEHGCIYCFARPTHAYLDLSPGLDFETRIFRKSDPRAHLRVELARPAYRCSVLAMGTNTDPYQPLERSQRVTREILETLLEYRHPVSIVTKSKLILRDLDLLREFAAQGLVHVNVSVTTLSNDLKTRLEPRTASPAARLRTIAELRSAGIPTGAMIAPIIPFINDHELEDLVTAVAAAGAMVARYILLRLPLEVKPLMEEWLAEHYPDRAARVMAAVRDTRGGRAYRAEWHTRMTGQGQIADLIRLRFARAVRAAGLANASFEPLRTDLFQPPHPTATEVTSGAQRAGSGQETDTQADESQLSLF